MNISETITSALQQIEGFMGDKVFTYNGEDYPCISGGVSETAQLVSGGFEVGFDKVLVVRKEVFTDGIYPTKKETVLFGAKTYRILTVIENGTEDFLKLVLEQPNKRK